MNLEHLIRRYKIIAILRNVSLDKTEDYIRAVYSGGVRLIEIAMNSPDALEQIKLAKGLYSELTVGAGTVMTTESVKAAVDAGAQFLLTPSVVTDVLTYCRANGIELLPGVMTATEVTVCLKYGFHTLKLFPASDLPDTYVKNLRGPFSDTSYVAVGGVTARNICNFLKCGFIGVGVGSALIPQEYVENGLWEQAREHVAGLVRSLGC